MTHPRGVARQLQSSIVPQWSIMGPFQWATVHAIHTSPNTVDVYMDGASTLTPGVRYLSTYTPTVGDVVVVGRMQAQSRTARFVIGKLA